MAYEPRLITPFVNSGLNQYWKPFLVGNTAFPDTSNVYPWRGSVRKREGYSLFGTLPGGDSPIQGIKNWINPQSLVANLITFSLIKSYKFNAGIFTDITQLSDGATPFSFGTTKFQYYWTSNFANSMWTTNGLGYVPANAPGAVNGLLYLTGNAINSWNIHTPQLDGTPTFLQGCLIVIPYKGRLVLLNTIEGTADGTSTSNLFQNRARWSQLGTPYVSTYNKNGGGTGPTSPPIPFKTDDNAWRSDIPGRGGFVDADTSERIVSAAIINDILIVGFQRSMWRLRYTGNEILPFIWERINTQYGAESTFSAISFDKDALFFSRYGWIASSTNEVQRIDQNIPDVSFSFETGSATSFQNLNTVQGIRDYYRQMAYWTFSPVTSTDDSQIYAYNYLDRSWSVFTPTNQINCFGEYFNTTDQTWTNYTNSWQSYNSPDDVWKNQGSSQNQGFPLILGGDAVSGNLYQMFDFQNPPTSDNTTNFNFSIQTKPFNPYFESGQKCRMGYVDLYITPETYGEILFQHFVDDQTSPVFSRNVSLYPRGVLQVSSIIPGSPTTITTSNPHNLISNQQVIMSNFYGSIAPIINNITTPVTVTTTTTFTIPINTTGYTSTSLGYIWLPPFNQPDARYTRIFLGAIGYHHQFVIKLSDDQLNDPFKAGAQFELQGMVIWTRPTGRIRG